MKWKDRFRFVRSNMKKNKSRVFMTVLATAMGCAFLIVLASVGFGLQRSVVKEITEGRLMTEITLQAKKVDNDEGHKPPAISDIELIRKMNHVKAVTFKQYLRQMTPITWKDKSLDLTTIAVDMEEEVKAGLELESGTMPVTTGEVVVGYHLASMLMEGEKATPESFKTWNNQLLGQTIQFQVSRWKGTEKESETFPVKVVGIRKQPTRELMRETDIYIDLGTLAKVEAYTGSPNGEIGDSPAGGKGNITKETPVEASGTRELDSVSVFAADASQVKEISDSLKVKGYVTHSIADELKQVNVLFAVMKIGLMFIGTIALLIASIGIYNTMTMAVTERAQDIGIMKAIGAHPSTIRSIFRIESSYIGLLGALIGTAVAYAISIVVNLALPVILSGVFNEEAPPGIQFSYIPAWLALVCIGLSIGVAILSGARPARRATQVDVLKALRRDI
ncbi:hypothetical protein SY83_18765 [Paenibacillus swuensis]|uniref:ABC transporter permease n=1 Tax=Paenibacillus swuensis TaxID=1178515 RepID=A0A172TM06_9BACL|nr:FtsX-like permease family protein [Paenibacillus swuensis]ANE47996.1 hypothetical protein SY83_18765 [Paenibacillus swuensis]